MDLEEATPNVESLFPPNPSEADIEPQFWTISDNDFNPDPTQYQDIPLPSETGRPVYNEYCENEARAEAEGLMISPEEQKYLTFLENLEYSEFPTGDLCFMLNSNPPS